MKNNLLIALFLFVAFAFFGQTDTIRIEKRTSLLFRCENENARNWYIYTTDNLEYVLATVNRSEDEVEDWFKRFSGSQNLYRSVVHYIGPAEQFFFRKQDQLDDLITFDIEDKSNARIVLTSQETGGEYVFIRIN